jgi:rubrerythrin
VFALGFFKRFTKPKGQLSLALHKNQLYFGEEVKGDVNLKSEEDFELERIRVILLCEESVKKVRLAEKTVRVREDAYDFESKKKTVMEEEEYIDYAPLYSDRVQVCNSMSVKSGFNKEFPFVIQLPLAGRETYHSVDNNVTWSVRAWMKIKGRKDIRAKGGGEILVAKPSFSTPSTKEVVREVVLISCSYCGGLMPQTAAFCPNCGARRK